MKEIKKKRKRKRGGISRGVHRSVRLGSVSVFQTG